MSDADIIIYSSCAIFCFKVHFTDFFMFRISDL